MQKLYIIKNTGAWMMDELKAFSQSLDFSILFLRDQGEFYVDTIKSLEEKGIKVYYLKRTRKFEWGKFFFCIGFFFRHFRCFLNFHSFVYGFKSLFFFLELDYRIFEVQGCNCHCQFATQASILALILKEYSRNKIVYSFTFHAYDIFVDNLWFSTLSSNAERAFSISKYNIDYVCTKYIVDRNKLYYSPLGVFPPEKLNVWNIRKDHDVLRLGFMSYFVKMKGIMYLLPAIKKLRELNVQFVMNIAGGGPLNDEMHRFVKKNGLGDIVIFHGLVKGEVKDKFLRNLDLFLLPSISKGMETDGLPVVLMEAASYGIPLISTNISGIPEICIDNYNGYLIEQMSVEAIVEAIINFNENRSKWKEFSDNSLEIASKYNIIKNSGEKLKLLKWN